MEQTQVIQATPYLIAYFEQQDRAKRLTVPGFMTRELSSYYAIEQRKMAQELVSESIKVGMLKSIQKQIKKLLRQAEQVQGEQLRKIGAKIEMLYEQAEKWHN